MAEKGKHGEFDERATKLRGMGHDDARLARELGVTQAEAREAVARGLAEAERRSPERAIDMAQELGAECARLQADAAAGDKAAGRLLPKMRRAYEQQVANARALNPAWTPLLEQDKRP